MDLNHQPSMKKIVQNVYFTIIEDIIKKDGSYTLKIDDDGMMLKGKDYQGIFYGVQTLLQLLRDK